MELLLNQDIGLKRVPIRELEPDLNNVLVVGVIIGKQRPRKFSDSKSGESEALRAVWNFTVRDSPRDYINVTYWGRTEQIFAVNDKFYTGDVVELIRPKVNIRKFNDFGEQYRPAVTSPYSLTLNEHSEILAHKGDDSGYQNLLHLPTKPIAGFVPLRDIHNEGGKMKDRFVDILAAVRSVGTIRNITTKLGEETQLREVVLFDHTSPGLKITIWDTDVMTRAVSWKPRTTILFITDTRIEWSNFLRSYSASLTNRSIVTENPIGKEATSLAIYAKTAPLEASAILDQMITALPDRTVTLPLFCMIWNDHLLWAIQRTDSIQNVLSVQQVHRKVNAFLQENCTAEQQVTALMFVVVTKLDLDGFSPVISTRCVYCKTYVKNASEKCENPECPMTLGTEEPKFDVTFDIRVHLTDHTGTLTNCRLTGQTAETILNCSVQQFLRMSDDQKAALKWKYLMERCAVRIMILLLNRRSPTISIVSCTKADSIEACQRMPVY